jgi:predicted transcriptional regulator
VRRRFFLYLVLIVASCAAVLAQSNGNINVEVTKLENSFPYLVLVGVAAGLLVVLIISLALFARSRRSPALKRQAGAVSIREPSASRDQGYYDTVFSRPKPEISDEKSPPVSFVNGADDAGVDRYLKEDERIVLNVLRMKHNSCSQATVRVVTDFSKARLSRILSELEARGIIYKEQKGRKNIITLRE